MFIAFLAVFVTALTSVIALLWLIRMIRLWNGELEATDAMSWVFLLITSAGITASVFLIRMTISVFTGV